MAVQFVLRSGPVATPPSTSSSTPPHVASPSSSSSQNHNSAPHLPSSSPSSSSSSVAHTATYDPSSSAGASSSASSSSSTHPQSHPHSTASPLRRSTRLHHSVPPTPSDDAVASGLVGPEVADQQDEAGPSRLRTTAALNVGVVVVEKPTPMMSEKRKTRKRARSSNFEVLSDGEGILAGEREGEEDEGCVEPLVPLASLKGKGKMVVSKRLSVRTRNGAGGGGTSSGEECVVDGGEEKRNEREGGADLRRTTRHTRSKSNPEGCFGVVAGKKKSSVELVTTTAAVNGASHGAGEVNGAPRRGRGAKRVRLSVDKNKEREEDEGTGKGKGKSREVSFRDDVGDAEGEEMVVESPDEVSPTQPPLFSNGTNGINGHGHNHNHNNGSSSDYTYGYPYRLFDAEGSLSPPPTLTPSPPPEDTRFRFDLEVSLNSDSNSPSNAPISSSSTGSVVDRHAVTRNSNQNGQQTEERATKRRRTRSSMRAGGDVGVDYTGAGTGSSGGSEKSGGGMEVDEGVVLPDTAVADDVEMEKEDAKEEVTGAPTTPGKKVGRGKRKRVVEASVPATLVDDELSSVQVQLTSTASPSSTPKRMRGSGRSGIKKVGGAFPGRRRSLRGAGAGASGDENGVEVQPEGEGDVGMVGEQSAGETLSSQHISPTTHVQAPHSIIQTRAAKLRSKTKDGSESTEPEASSSARAKSKPKSQSRSPPVDSGTVDVNSEYAASALVDTSAGMQADAVKLRRRKKRVVNGEGVETRVLTRRRKAKVGEEGGDVDAMQGVEDGERKKKGKMERKTKAGKEKSRKRAALGIEEGAVASTSGSTTPTATSTVVASVSVAAPTPQQLQRQQRAQQRQLRQMQKGGGNGGGGAGGKMPPPPPPPTLNGKRVAVPTLKLQAEGLTPLSSLSSLSSLSPPSSPTNGSSGGNGNNGGNQQVQYRPPNPITTPPIAHGSTMPTVHSPLTSNNSMEKIGGVVGAGNGNGSPSNSSTSGSGGSTPTQANASTGNTNAINTSSNNNTGTIEPPSAPGSPSSSTASLAGSPTSTSPHTLSAHTSHSLSAHALTLLHTHTPPSSPPHSPNLGLWRGSGAGINGMGGMGAGGGVGGPPLDAVDVGPLLPLSLSSSGVGAKEGGGGSGSNGNGNGNSGSLVGRKDKDMKEREGRDEESNARPLTPMSVLGISVRGLTSLDTPSSTVTVSAPTSATNTPAPTSTTNTPVGSPVTVLSTIPDVEQQSSPQTQTQALSSMLTPGPPPAGSALFAIPPPLSDFTPATVSTAAGSTSPNTSTTPLLEVSSSPSTPPPVTPVLLPMSLASESEIGFGFQSQEGFLSSTALGGGNASASSPDAPSGASLSPATPTQALEGVDMNVDAGQGSSVQSQVQSIPQDSMSGVTHPDGSQQQQQQHSQSHLSGFGMFDALGGANGIGSGLVGMVGVGVGVDSPFGTYHHQAPDVQRDGEQQQGQAQSLQLASDQLQPQTQQDGSSDALQYSFFNSLAPLPASVGNVTLAGGMISGHHNHHSLHHHQSHESSGSHDVGGNAQSGQDAQGGGDGMLLDPMGLQMGGMGDLQMGGGSGAGGAGAGEMGGIALPVPLPVPMFPSVGDVGSGSAGSDANGFGVGEDGLGMQVEQQQQEQMDQQQQQMQQHQLQQQQQQQQQQHQPPQQTYSNQMLNARAHRRVEYQPPRPLEEAPLLNKDGNMWKIACKLRVWEITKRYSPDTIRSVVAQDAHDYFVATGRFPAGYGLNASSSRSRWGHHHSSSFSGTYGNSFGRYGRSKLGTKRRGSLSRFDDRDKTRSRSHTPTPEGENTPSPDSGALSPTSSSPPLSPGEDEDFMYEKIYPFELLDDDSTDDALSPLSPTGGGGDLSSRPVASIGGIVVDPRWAEEYDEDETDEEEFDEEDEEEDDDDDETDDDDDDDDDETEGDWEEADDMDMDIEGFEDVESDEEVAAADGVKVTNSEIVTVVDKEGEEVKVDTKEGAKEGEGENGQITGAILGKGLLAAIKGKTKAVIGAMGKGRPKTSSRSGSPAVDPTKTDSGSPTVGRTSAQEEDPDAEGEMEVDIEPFSDPSFNAELSSPTSPTAEVLPINSSPGGTMSSFYIPTLPGGNGGMNVGGFFGSGTSSPNASPSADPTHVRQEPPPLQLDQQPQNVPQQQQGPLQIQLPPPVYHVPPPMPILPLPPPRLDTIRVAWLRSTELGAKLTGRGTPADRDRADQWAKGWTGYARSTTSPLGERQEGGITEEMGNASAGKNSNVDVDVQMASAQSQWDELLAGLHGTSPEDPSRKSGGGGLASEMVVTPSIHSGSNINESIADPALRPATPQPDPSVSSTAATSSAGDLGINIGLFDMGGMSMNMDMEFVGNMMVNGPSSSSSPTTMEGGNAAVTSDPSWFTQSTQDGLQQSHQLGHTTPMSMRIQSGPGTDSYVDTSSSTPHATSGTSTLSFALG